jgi:hypothetical protein
MVRACVGLLAAAFLTSTGAAQDLAPLLPLPQLSQCSAATHPRLPEKWRAVFLMAPFTNAQLVLGEIIHDGSIPATRVRLHGVRNGSAEFLIAGSNTYVPGSRDSAAQPCRNLGDTGWRPLPQDWLTPQSHCSGSAPIGETPVDWWKTPIAPAPSTDWIWFRISDRTPFRLVFQSPSNRLGVLSRYAMSNQVSFEPLPQTELGGIAATCRSARPAASTGAGAGALRREIEAMAHSGERADAEIGRILPALRASCPAVPLPVWPEKLALTGLLTPFDANEEPVPTEVLYDWSVLAQRSRIFLPPRANAVVQDALLLGPAGYNVAYRRNGGKFCPAGLPGTIRPDWAMRAPCDCEATIEGGTPLTPYGAARILSCPLARPRAAWAWYTLDGRPMTFMVTSLRGDEGAGLFAALDYRLWAPDRSFPRAVFEKPQCDPAPPGATHTAAQAVARNARQCSTCHLGETGSR